MGSINSKISIQKETEEILENFGYKGDDKDMKHFSINNTANFELGKIYTKDIGAYSSNYLYPKLSTVFEKYSNKTDRYFIVKYGQKYVTFSFLDNKIIAEKIQFTREINYDLITSSDINTQYIQDCFLVFIMKNEYNLEILEKFISFGLDPLSHDMIKLICRYGKLQVLKWLVSKGADVKFQDNVSLFLACKYGQLHVAEYLVSQGVEFDTQILKALDNALENKFIVEIQYRKFMDTIVYNKKLW